MGKLHSQLLMLFSDRCEKYCALMFIINNTRLFYFSNQHVIFLLFPF